VGVVTAPPTLERIRAARPAIVSSAIRTPLVPLNVLDAPASINLKLENLQPIGSFKVRAAAYAMSAIDPQELAEGVLTASAGNMGQAVAWEARRRGIPCSVVVPDTAPQRKIEGMRQLGARIISVSFDEWWETLAARAYPGIDGLFIHPFDDENVLAGDGTIGLEIVEEMPEVEAVLVPWGGGGLSTGIAAAIRSVKPDCRVFAVEVDGAAPLAASLAAGQPVTIEYRPSFVDGIGSKTVFPNMLELARTLLAGSLVATVGDTARCVGLLAKQNRVVAEGAGAAPVAVALSGQVEAERIACVVSGGNLDAHKLTAILAGEVP
jgi:threonine dehydratase